MNGVGVLPRRATPPLALADIRVLALAKFLDSVHSPNKESHAQVIDLKSSEKRSSYVRKFFLSNLSFTIPNGLFCN